MAQFVIILCVVGIVIWILKMMFKLTFKSLIVLCIIGLFLAATKLK
ncbi:TPA: hypothetical protein KOR75_001184 [Clostridioides difficile]|jgi:hypothetical protein|nr:hypothetical protein [Clostridioides difficile]